jgi:hypothetical protein
VQQRDPMAAFGFVKIGGGHENRDAFVEQRIEDAPKVPP